MKFDPHQYILDAGWDWDAVQKTAEMGLADEDLDRIYDSGEYDDPAEAADALLEYCRWRVEQETDAEEDGRLMTITIRGVKIAAPEGAVAYKYADPEEDARWIYDEDEATEIAAEDPSLLVWVDGVDLDD